MAGNKPGHDEHVEQFEPCVLATPGTAVKIATPDQAATVFRSGHSNSFTAPLAAFQAKCPPAM
jgi:hypothetical protein